MNRLIILYEVSSNIDNVWSIIIDRQCNVSSIFTYMNSNRLNLYEGKKKLIILIIFKSNIIIKNYLLALVEVTYEKSWLTIRIKQVYIEI
jgi:hypothetical protein